MPVAAISALRLLAAVVVAASAPALATSQRTFVSGQGSDAAACSIAAPCRSFTAAIAQTVAGGEVIVLDSAGYGPVVITQSVTITAPPGVYAGISVPASAPIGVLINVPAGKIVLRGLTVNSTGGTTGIQFLAGDGLSIERCRISGFSVSAADGGIRQDSVGVMTVRDTAISDGYNGVRMNAGSATLEGVSLERLILGVCMLGGRMTIRASTISEGSEGVLVESGVVSLDGVTISHMAAIGIDAHNPAGFSLAVHVIRSQVVGSYKCIFADSPPGSFTSVHVTDSLIANCTYGVYTDGAALAIVSNSTIVSNGTGLYSNGPFMYSMKNNEIFDNASSSSGLILPISYQ